MKKSLKKPMFRKTQYLILSIILSSMLIGGLSSFNNTSEVQITITNPNSSYFMDKTIDGIIESSEWSSAKHKIEFFLDVDNTGDPKNVDGNNYLYIDEDYFNLYLAMDLCSDQTNDQNGEWVGIWINTNDTNTNSMTTWEDALNKGTESLIYDVDNNRILPFLSDDIGGIIHDLKSNDEYSVINGTKTPTGDYTNFANDNDPDFNMTSEWNGTHYISRIDFEIDLVDYFNNFKEIFAENTQNCSVRVKNFNNITIDQCLISIPDENSNLDLNNPLITVPINNGITSVFDEYMFNKGNFTEDNRFLFSLVCINDAPFNASYEILQIGIYNNLTTNLAGVMLPYTSINHFNLAFNFNSSENNASNHRMFEYRIPKYELEGYKSMTNLSLYLAGYGTMAIEDTDQWAYERLYQGSVDYMMYSDYYNYKMPLKVDSIYNTGSFELSVSNVKEPYDDGIFNLVWTDSEGADNYSIYELVTYNDNVANFKPRIKEYALSGYEIIAQETKYYVFAVASFNETGCSVSNYVGVNVKIIEGLSGGIITTIVIISLMGIGSIGFLIYKYKFKKMKK